MKNTKEKISIQELSDHKEIQDAVHNYMKHRILDVIYRMFNDEVTKLCGPLYNREKECMRSGSDPGSVYAQGQRVSIRKPRVKKDGKDIKLQTYSALRNYDVFTEKIQNHLFHGVSTRDYDPLLEEISGGTGVKKSSVSRAFVNSSKKALDEISSKDLSKHEFVSVMIDGVGFGDRTVVVALGIDVTGKKHIIGLREGTTENCELTKDLLENLVSRGSDKGYLFIIDGSKALRKAIKAVWGKKSVVQRCIRHKERNILNYLPKERHQEFRIRWKRLHGSVDYESALKEHEELVCWLKQINHSALESLEEACKETLTVIRLKATPSLKKTLLSTNPIESMFSYTRYRTGRVKNWKRGADQVSRWAAVTLFDAEKRFKRIRGFMYLKNFKENLEKMVAKQRKVA